MDFLGCVRLLPCLQKQQHANLDQTTLRYLQEHAGDHPEPCVVVHVLERLAAGQLVCISYVLSMRSHIVTAAIRRLLLWTNRVVFDEWECSLH